MDYKRKIDFAIRLLRNIPQDGPIEISYSGGKDSDVILELARMAGIPHEAIYKQTTIDPPGTTAHAKTQGATIIRPKMSFFEIVRRRGFPTRFHRVCCEVLKEYKVRDRAVQGIRRDESTKRAELYKEPEICRTYPGKEKVRVYLPILEWDTEDVARFIDERGIKCAPVYYDADGNFHPERRLGCLGCPLAAEWKRREVYKQYPRMLKESIRATQVFASRNPNYAINKHFPDVYHKFFADLFFKCHADYLDFIQGRLFEADFDAKSYLETYFGIPL